MGRQKLFISQPMKGKTDKEILEAKEDGLKLAELKLGDFEVIDTFFKDFDGNRLEFLGKSIMDGLAKADVALFLDDWEKFDGCRAEHFIAAQYGVRCIYA
jgi:hypothetical protein